MTDSDQYRRLRLFLFLAVRCAAGPPPSTFVSMTVFVPLR